MKNIALLALILVTPFLGKGQDISFEETVEYIESYFDGNRKVIGEVKGSSWVISKVTYKKYCSFEFLKTNFWKERKVNEEKYLVDLSSIELDELEVGKPYLVFRGRSLSNIGGEGVFLLYTDSENQARRYHKAFTIAKALCPKDPFDE